MFTAVRYNNTQVNLSFTCDIIIQGINSNTPWIIILYLYSQGIEYITVCFGRNNSVHCRKIYINILRLFYLFTLRQDFSVCDNLFMNDAPLRCIMYHTNNKGVCQHSASKWDLGIVYNVEKEVWPAAAHRARISRFVWSANQSVWDIFCGIFPKEGGLWQWQAGQMLTEIKQTTPKRLVKAKNTSQPPTRYFPERGGRVTVTSVTNVNRN